MPPDTDDATAATTNSVTANNLVKDAIATLSKAFFRS
jgi:hypothetical protein